ARERGEDHQHDRERDQQIQDATQGRHARCRECRTIRAESIVVFRVSATYNAQRRNAWRRAISERSVRVWLSQMPASTTTLEIEGRSVVITNPDKVYFPHTGHTKLDLVNYYLSVADGALRGVCGRPMAMKRFVNGADAPPFFQKRAPGNRPDWIETIE